MTSFGLFLSSEELSPASIVRTAESAERAGFDRLWISDHFHPWNDAQGEAPFVWTVLGALLARTERAVVTTAVTCPTVRTHPVVVAQAAATTAALAPGRFQLGVGTGENLNEHVTGARWPAAEERLEMLEEAVDVMRALWTGELVRHRGRHYVVDTARLYTVPDAAPPVLVSGFGAKATRLAARIGDGYINTSPDEEMLQLYRSEGGSGPAQAGVKVCWAEDRDDAVRTVHQAWGHTLVPGEASQELPMPAHFEQLRDAVTEQQVAESFACGPRVEDFVDAVRPYVEAGYDEVYLSQVGEDQEGFLRFWERDLRDALADL